MKVYVRASGFGNQEITGNGMKWGYKGGNCTTILGCISEEKRKI
jgi:hypothetical protein